MTVTDPVLWAREWHGALCPARRAKVRTGTLRELGVIPLDDQPRSLLTQINAGAASDHDAGDPSARPAPHRVGRRCTRNYLRRRHDPNARAMAGRSFFSARQTITRATTANRAGGTAARNKMRAAFDTGGSSPLASTPEITRLSAGPVHTGCQLRMESLK